MTWSPDSSITGPTTITGLTSPTYGTVADLAPEQNGVQHAVTSLGGTQTNVRTHSISDPFTATFYKPKNPKALPSPNPVTGRYGSIPKNTFGLIIRKGVNFAANQAPESLTMRLTVDVPAGSDSYDAANIRAAVAFLVGLLNEEANDLADSLITGIV
jgi:hypothetical protein